MQVVFLFAALILLVLTLFSGSFRAWLKVNINKYFFTYRYDYRYEWLRLIGTISSVVSGRALSERVMKGLADIVESPEGTLCARTASSTCRRPGTAGSSRASRPPIRVSSSSSRNSSGSSISTSTGTNPTSTRISSSRTGCAIRATRCAHGWWRRCCTTTSFSAS